MNLLRVTKNEIDIAEYHHGGEQVARASESKMTDFSVNVNPLGLPEGVKSAIQNAIPDLERYPDQSCTRLREKLAEKLRISFGMTGKGHGLAVPFEHIICGNGASELISLVTNAISPKNALLLVPTFSGYEKALKAARTKVQYHFLKAEACFALDETIFDSIQKNKPDMIFLCSPNNPTGGLIEKPLLEQIAAQCDESGIFLVADECFLDFTEHANETMFRFVEENPHLVVLNAFTKIYAMAGIRLGYLATSNLALLHKINALRPEWNVSTLAQIAGEAALDERSYIEETRTLIKQERDYLSKELKALGFRVFPSEANFILFSTEVEKLGNFLQEREIFLRNCGNFTGLSEKFYRTAVRTHEENARLLKNLRAVVAKCATSQTDSEKFHN